MSTKYGARIAELVEADVGIEGERHEEDHWRVQEDQASLTDVSVVCRREQRFNSTRGACVRRDRAQLTEEHQTRAEKSDDARVTTLSHDGIDDGGNCASEQGGQGAHADVGHLVLDVRVADVFELELSVKADEPSLERQQKFCSVRGRNQEYQHNGRGRSERVKVLDRKSVV